MSCPIKTDIYIKSKPAASRFPAHLTQLLL